MQRCLIEQNVSTAVVSHPFEQGWLTEPAVELLPQLTAEKVAAEKACALVGSVDASLLLDSHVVVVDFGLVSRHTGPFAVRSEQRLDEVDDAAVAIRGISRTAEAVARTTVFHFFGINVAQWDENASEGDVVVLEDAAAFQARDLEHLGDLVRAWFILTSFPLPTHLLVVPKELAANDPAAVVEVVRTLNQAVEVSTERRRELRRNVTDDYGLDRDRFVEFQSDQQTTVSKTARKAWLDLLRRTQHAMKLPPVKEPDFVSVGEASEQ